MGHLLHDEILNLHAAVVSANLLESRASLFSGISGDFSKRITSGTNPGDQSLLDLDALNEAGTLENGQMPLAIWLSNARSQTTILKESAVFAAALARCKEPPADGGRSATTTIHRGLEISDITRDILSPEGRVTRPPQISNYDESERTFEAIARAYQEAHDCIELAPLRAARSAREIIDHITDYLDRRELDRDGLKKPLDATITRLHAKGVLPFREARELINVLQCTRSVIPPDPAPRTAAAGERGPWLGSLDSVVDWFFREYLKRPSPLASRSATSSAGRGTPVVPDTTPINSTTKPLNADTQFGTGIGEFMPVWRSKAASSTLTFNGAVGQTMELRTFKIDDPQRNYRIGRDPRSDGPNDFVIPRQWGTVSHAAGIVSTFDGEVRFTNTSGKSNTYVRGVLLPADSSRTLRHCDVVQLGACVGMYSDGRYYSVAPAIAVDMSTGLLSRVGLLSEIAGYLATGSKRVLFVVRCSDGSAYDSAAGPTLDPERLAAKVALGLHRLNPAAPVARIGIDVAVLLPSQEAVEACARAASEVVATPCVSGFLPLSGLAERSSPLLEACLGALNRIAIAGRAPADPVDLKTYALVPIPPDEFCSRVRPLFEEGGGAVLLALGERDRLAQLPDNVINVLELELLEMLGARMGTRDVATVAGRGLVAFGTPGDVDRFAQEIGVAWHARGSVTVSKTDEAQSRVEIDRSLTGHLLAPDDLRDLAGRAASLVDGGIGTLGVGGFPAPLALAAQALDDANTPVERARRLVDLAELAWKLLAFSLVASARAAGVSRAQESAAQGTSVSWPSPWRSLARDAASRIDQHQGRLTELATAALSADASGPLHAAMDSITQVIEQLRTQSNNAQTIERALPRLERALRDMFSAFGPLRGWTLAGVESSEVVDPVGASQRIEYSDYTGPSARGSRQRVSVNGFRSVGRFVYLVRWHEGMAIALEPFVRRLRNELTGNDELFLAEAPILTPGEHLYRSITSSHKVELTVTSKQLGLAL
jgi:hypothetical protein